MARNSGLAFVGTGLVALAWGCTNDFDSFQFFPDASGGSGAGTTTTSSTSTGGSSGCSTADDCPGTDTNCQSRTCNSKMCGLANAPVGTGCTENGGKVCNGMGECVACAADSDCTDGKFCSSGTCVDPTCGDTKKNGKETDVDCGGPDCKACENGKDCLVAGDCETIFCDQGNGGAGGAGGGGAGGSGTGGSGGAPMQFGKCAPCVTDGDCAAGGDLYCAVDACKNKFKQGDACAMGNECTSGNCTDGVCCDTACGELCAACTMVKTGEADGTCAAVTTGTDPETECADQGAASCDANGMGCSGNVGACVLYSNATACAAASCDNVKNEQSLQSLCDGNGTCAGVSPTKCDPYVCGTTSCKTSCAAKADCKAGNYCDSAAACKTCGTNKPAPGSMMCPAVCNGGCVGATCTIDCTGPAQGGGNGNGKCEGNNVTCPVGYDCFVDCSGDDGCQDATINCPADYKCTVNCANPNVPGYQDQCKGANINASQTGSLLVTCGTDNEACNGTAIACKANECKATCAGNSKPALNGQNNSCGATACP